MKSKEVLFQLVLNAIIFLFYSYDRRVEGIEPFRIAYFINYALAATIINYLALPRYYKNRKTFEFIAIFILCLIASVLAEELILEKIFFPERGASIKALYAFIEIIPVVSILTGAKFAWDALNKQREVDLLKDAVRNSELMYLKSQINPHFLFNNLNNLYSYALEGSKKTPDIILELSGLLRYMLYECQDEYVSLKKEVKHLENFINLNELQIEDRGQVSFTKHNITEEHKIAPLILVVFVENAFKHSVGSLSENIKIDVTIGIDNDGILKFTCENTFDETANNDSIAKGIGLANVRKRLDLIYPKDYVLKIEKQSNIYKVDLEIKLS
jgi:hypothetical protein